ncbi:MAG: hypothetical protein ACTSUF_12055 [Candidatus Heimdallarchaeaceae archaeon]
MSYFQILTPHKVREFLKVNEHFLRALVKEPPRTSKRGKKRIAKRWMIVALVVIARIEGIAWRKLGEKLAYCDFLVEEGWMIKLPSKSTFHAVWSATDKRLLEQWIILLGKEINSRREVKGLAADSSGFKNRQACLWRFLKWSKGALRRTSTLFSKYTLLSLSLQER